MRAVPDKQREDGMLPVKNLLPRKDKFTSRVKLPRDNGIVPVNDVLKNDKSWS